MTGEKVEIQDMDANIKLEYRQYRDKLCNIGLGFGPSAGDGTGFKFIEAMVSLEDAALIVKMKYEWQTAAEYAALVGIDEKEAFDSLYDASKRGGVYRKKLEDGTYMFQPSGMAHGVWEFAVERQQPEWVTDFFVGNMGKPNTFNHEDNPVPFFRTMPISKDVLAEGEVLTEWNDVEKYIREASCINVWTCACCEAFRKGNPGERRTMRGRPVDPTQVEKERPLDACMVLNEMAEYYTENGWGRKISLEEALELKNTFIDKGLVPEVFNSKKAEVVCFCDGDYCLTLPQRKYFPVSDYSTDYVVKKDDTKCIDCGKCVERCPIDLYKITEDGKVTLPNTKPCMGCGVCVPVCPTSAIQIYLKPGAGTYVPPDDLGEQNIGMAEYSGRDKTRPYDPTRS